ncbi:hypothetical protein GCM10010156_20870 [Planobispora rosea]|uniref:Uncharacterized protein n=1 Tax=Planobispora rosea TaxID=35762 RepID=A0A8J3S5N3_PLARO|nr:sigma-70 family RNA polymerase sigma factor [Planobispora rosea]GGS61949.1 hypothetical protein GCM10010156_20870 [Planobispora rosea]GIH86590.1 hypothetical protein Pro02_49980 [Planobispora rosea]
MDALQSDAGLLAAIRGGNAAAYVGLYERHVAAARALSRQLVHTPAEVEDILAETFTRLLDLIRRDGGPREAFRPYLLTALRRTAYERGRGEDGQGAGTEIELFDPGVPFVDPALTGLERSLVARAFLSLSERWQLVLWHTEVERADPAEVGLLLGLPQDAVPSFACQALEGLRQACLRTHLAGTPHQGCRAVLAKMGAYVRGGLAKRESRSVDRHVEGCADCRVVFMELNDVSQGLRVIVGPLIAGSTLSGYLTALGRTDRGGGLLGSVIGWGREPGRWRQIGAATGAAVALTLAVALIVMTMGDPVLFGSAHTSTPIPAPIVAQPGPDGPPPSEGSPPGDPGPPGQETPEPGRSTVVVPPFGRRAEPAPRPEAGPAPAARLVARIDALGALVRSEQGMVAVRLRNAGTSQSGKLVARVVLPDGVTLLPRVRRNRTISAVGPVALTAPVVVTASVGMGAVTGRAGTVLGSADAGPAETRSADAGLTRARPALPGSAGSSGGPVGTVDGWSCRPVAAGARCTRGPLAAGRSTAIFLRVTVSPEAPEGGALSVRITGGEAKATAVSASGVRATGAPARFATDGRVTTAAIGNTLLSRAPTGSARVIGGAAQTPADRRCGNDRGHDHGNDRGNDRGKVRGERESAEGTPGGVIRSSAVRSSGIQSGETGSGGSGPEKRPRERPEEMRSVDLDRDPSTGSSSAARLVLPKRSRVVWAGLYWSASAPAAGPVKFKAPGDEHYTRVRAVRTAERRLPTGRAYQAFADVTRLVHRLRGRYWVADVPVRNGAARYAGWSLVVIAADPRRPYSQAVVVDTVAAVGPATPAQVPLGGLTPAAPARVSLVAWGGEAGLKGDRVTMERGGALRPEGGSRDPGNVFDGSSTGALGTRSTPGVDVDGFRVPLGRAPVIRVSTRRDAVLFGVAMVQVQARL